MHAKSCRKYFLTTLIRKTLSQHFLLIHMKYFLPSLIRTYILPPFSVLVEPETPNVRVTSVLVLLLLFVLKYQPMLLLWTPYFTINHITLFPITLLPYYHFTILPYYHFTILPFYHITPRVQPYMLWTCLH